MLFETQSKADNFIKFNADTILEASGKSPERSYYCVFCGGYHITSNASEDDGEQMNTRDYNLMDKAISLGRQKSLQKKEYDILFPPLKEKITKIKELITNWHFDEVQALLNECMPEIEELRESIPTKADKLMIERHKLEVIQNVVNRKEELCNLSEKEITYWLSIKAKTLEEKQIIKMLKQKVMINNG
jgi:hypothetical protein